MARLPDEGKRALDVRVFGLNWDVIWRNRDEFLSGLALGLKLALIGLAIACVIGLLVAFARTSRYRWLSRIAGWHMSNSSAISRCS